VSILKELLVYVVKGVLNCSIENCRADPLAIPPAGLVMKPVILIVKALLPGCFITFELVPIGNGNGLGRLDPASLYALTNTVPPKAKGRAISGGGITSI